MGHQAIGIAGRAQRDLPFSSLYALVEDNRRGAAHARAWPRRRRRVSVTAFCARNVGFRSGKHALRVGTQSPQSQTVRDTAVGTYTVTLEVTLTPVAVTAHSRMEAFWTVAMDLSQHREHIISDYK